MALSAPRRCAVCGGRLRTGGVVLQGAEVHTDCAVHRYGSAERPGLRSGPRAGTAN